MINNPRFCLKFDKFVIKGEKILIECAYYHLTVLRTSYNKTDVMASKMLGQSPVYDINIRMIQMPFQRI